MTFLLVMDICSCEQHLQTFLYNSKYYFLSEFIFPREEEQIDTYQTAIGLLN